LDFGFIIHLVLKSFGSLDLTTTLLRDLLLTLISSVFKIFKKLKKAFDIEREKKAQKSLNYENKKQSKK